MSDHEGLGSAEITFWFHSDGEWKEAPGLQQVRIEREERPQENFIVGIGGTAKFVDPHGRFGGAVIATKPTKGLVVFAIGTPPTHFDPFLYFAVTSKVKTIKVGWLEERQVSSPRPVILIPIEALQ